jgi:hypothetical protein
VNIFRDTKRFLGLPKYLRNMSARNKQKIRVGCTKASRWILKS